MLETRGYKPIFIALYGSQNYNLDTPNSDFDFKAVVVPTIEDIAFNRKPISTSIKLSNGLCDIKDIRLMASCWKKQNVNFIELLFSKATVISPHYKELLKPLFDFKENIAHLDEKRAVSCMFGMAKDRYNDLFTPLPSQQSEVENYGYAAKRLASVLYLEKMMRDYLKGREYQKCLDFTGVQREKILNIKTYKEILTLDEAKNLAEEAIERMKQLKEKSFYNYHSLKTERIIDNVILNCLQRGFSTLM